MRRALLAAITLLPIILAGCGIAFGRGREGNDFFTSLEVTGEMASGSPLTAAVSYETFYPFEVDVICELRQGKNLIGQIGVGRTPAIPGNRTPDDDRVPGNFSFDFTAPQPGTYKVECYTRLDDENYILKEFRVRAAP